MSRNWRIEGEEQIAGRENEVSIRGIKLERTATASMPTLTSLPESLFLVTKEIKIKIRNHFFTKEFY